MQRTISVAPFGQLGHVLCAAAGDYGSSDALRALAQGWEHQLSVDDGEQEEPTSGDRGERADEAPNEPDTDGPDEEPEEDGEAGDEESEEEPEPDEEPESEEDEAPEEEDGDDPKGQPDNSFGDDTPVKVTVNGQEQEITLGELRSGYSRTQDYTAKTQALAEQRRQLQEELDQTTRSRQEWSNYLKQLEDATRARMSLYSDDELQRLRNEDSYAYADALEKQRKFEQELGKIEAARRETDAETQQVQRAQYERMRQSEFEQLQSKLPEWQDESTRKQELDAISQYAKDQGLEQELAQTIDHRMFLVLRDAAKYRASQQRAEVAKNKAAQAKQQAKPKTTGNLKPGQPQSPSTRKKAKSQKSQDRFRKSGSVDDAASWIADTFL